MDNNKRRQLPLIYTPYFEVDGLDDLDPVVVEPVEVTGLWRAPVERCLARVDTVSDTVTSVLTTALTQWS